MNRQICTSQWYRCNSRKGGECILSSMETPIETHPFIHDCIEGNQVTHIPVLSRAICEYRWAGER